MKKTFLLFALALPYAPDVTAQKWSLGARTGIEQLNTNLDEQDFKNRNLLWHNQVFLGRQLCRNFEIEAALGYSDHSISHTGEDWNHPGTLYAQKSREQNITLLLSARYYLFRTGRLGLFAQAGTTTLKTFSSYTSTVYTSRSAPQTYNGEKGLPLSLIDRFHAGLGFRCYASRRFFLTGHVNIYVKTGASTAMTMNRSDWVSGLYLGCGFRL